MVKISEHPGCSEISLFQLHEILSRPKVRSQSVWYVKGIFRVISIGIALSLSARSSCIFVLRPILDWRGEPMWFSVDRAIDIRPIPATG